MKIYFRISVLLNIVLVISLSGCGTLKPQAGKSSGKHFETFFTGESGTQYFIKPLRFEAQDDGYLYADFTFRSKQINQDSAILNFTISQSVQIKQCDSLRLEHPQFGTTSAPFTFMFSSRSKNLINNRFSGKLPVDLLKTLFENPEWTLTVYSPQGNFTFKPSTKTSKRIASVHYSVFSLM